MAKGLVILGSLALSWFGVFAVAIHWGPALVYAMYGAVVFSPTLLVVSLVIPHAPWRAFLMTNIILIAIFGGAEIYAGHVLRNPNSIRFGQRLWIDGHVTAAGLASIAFDIAICTLANVGGFSLARFLITRLGLKRNNVPA
jgi:hypothetical protein